MSLRLLSIQRILHWKYAAANPNLLRLSPIIRLSSTRTLSRSQFKVVTPVSHLTDTFSLSLKTQLRLKSSRSEKRKEDENKDDNDDTASPFALTLIGTACAGLAFALYVFNGLVGNVPVIDTTTLFSRLERDEVEKIYVAFNKIYILWRPHLNRQIEMIPVHFYRRLEIIEGIRRVEKKLGIRKGYGVPIEFGVPSQVGMLASATHHITPLVLVCLMSIFVFCVLATQLKGKHVNGKTKKQIKREHPSIEETQSAFSSPLNLYGAPFSPVTNTNIRFRDIAGMHACKQEVMEFVSFMKDPEKYQLLGAKLPKGALLVGPPGTGKTLLVKALANEADVPFFSIAGSQFVEIYGGMGAARVRRLFQSARERAPSIIFIDELDSVGRRRDSGRSAPSYGEMEQTLNQLLVEMDGMNSDELVTVFAATNRSDLLDPALLRAGRFDRHIFVDLPNLAERKELLDMYMGKCRLDPSLDKKELVDFFAKWTAGRSGADIAQLCNEAVLAAVRRDKRSTSVIQADFDTALERIVVGAAKLNNPLSPPERRVAAVQEAGRVLIAWLLPKTGLVPAKVSIVPRTSATTAQSGGLGFTQLIPDDRHLYNADELNDRIAVLLGGRAAEQVIFNAVSDASKRYLRQAYHLASLQVREFGLSEVIGNISFTDDATQSTSTLKPYSQHTQMLMEMETQRLVSAAFARCMHLLTEHKHLLQALVSSLLEREVLTRDQIVHICQGAPASGLTTG